MVDAALGWAEQANPSSILRAKCHPNDEALSSVDEDFLPPTPISSLLSLPNPVELENDMDVVSSASPITLIETQERCVYPSSKDSAPSHTVVLVEGPLQHRILTNFDEDPTQLEHPGLLEVPEPASTISDSARSAEYSTPSPKTPSTLGPLAYPPSSPLPSPPSSPPSAFRTTLGLGLHLGRPESQVAPPSDSTASPNVSPIVKTHTLRKSRPDSSEYFLSPPIELASGRHKFTTDKISDLPNHFVPLPAPLPFAEGLPDDIISAPKRRSPTTKSTTQSIDTKDESEPPKAWLKIRLYDEPDSSDFEQENWEVTLDTTNLLKPSWEEKGAVTLLAKNRQLPWKCLAPYLLKDKPICLYRRPMGRFDLALHKGLGLMLNLVGLILLFWQPWRKDFWSSSCAVLANVLPMLGQWVLRLEKRSGERTVDPFLNSINQLDPRRVF
ncbi:hypothetical protein H0H93_008311 [Arthromyces matolae]|nr:hypothetical protein H0H93_008311 [Arthromyces matolae]